ncbi:MAG: hypothetical protein O3B01_04350 [Planctomycetota bacterium]|nr:hypothetical protein [Planctomycetota bacterium]MDA1137792.1 hypothetical protein [Planctomycetota bacterium]
MKRIYEFTLIVSDQDLSIIDQLYARCSDASAGKNDGQSYVAFDREAESLESAIQSAVEDLRSLNIEPIRLEMDVPEATSV